MFLKTKVTCRVVFTMLHVNMLPSELWKCDGETKLGGTESDGLQFERIPLFSPITCSRKSDTVDFVKLNNHGNLLYSEKFSRLSERG